MNKSLIILHQKVLHNIFRQFNEMASVLRVEIKYDIFTLSQLSEYKSTAC